MSLFKDAQSGINDFFYHLQTTCNASLAGMEIVAIFAG